MSKRAAKVLCAVRINASTSAVVLAGLRPKRARTYGLGSSTGC
jgi:hypothetical protein